MAWTLRARRSNVDLLAMVLLAELGAGLASVSAVPTPVRALCVSPLVLVLPGLAATEAAFLPGTLTPPQRLALSVGASLAISVVVGLVLDLLPAGLSARPWAAALGALSFVCACVALARRLAAGRAGGTLPPSPGSRSAELDRPSRLRTRRLSSTSALGVAALVIACLLGGAYAIARNGALAQARQDSFTQLWMLPAGSTKPDTVMLGVRSDQATTQRYILGLQAAGRTVWTSPPLTLASGQQWQSSVSVGTPANAAAPSPPLIAVLFRSGSSAPYRHVDAPAGWLQGTPGP